MSSGPSNDPVIQQLQLLLTGYGYNFYSTVNQARTDDQLVRERASYHISEAANMLSNLQGDTSVALFRLLPVPILIRPRKCWPRLVKSRRCDRLFPISVLK